MKFRAALPDPARGLAATWTALPGPDRGWIATRAPLLVVKHERARVRALACAPAPRMCSSSSGRTSGNSWTRSAPSGR